MASEDEILEVRLRLQGGRVFLAETGAAAGAVTGFGKAAEGAAHRTELARVETFAWRQSLYTLRRELFFATAAVFGTIAGIERLGFNFNEAKASGIAFFTQTLGGARAARREVATLIALTHQSGLGLPDLQEGAQRLMEFGFTLLQTNELLRVFGVYTAKHNLGAAGLQSLVAISTQIRQSGLLTGRTMAALTRMGIPIIRILQEQLHLTDLQINQIRRGKLAVPASLALPALSAGLATAPGSFGVRTLLGQIRSWVAELAGAIEQPLSGWATRVGPKITAALGRATTGFKSGGFRGMFAALDPSGRALAAWTIFARVMHTALAVAGALWVVIQAGMPILSALAGILSLVAGHGTALNIVVGFLIARYIYLRTVSLLVVASQLLVGKSMYTTMGWTAKTTAATKLYEMWVLRSEIATLALARAQKVLQVALRLTGLAWLIGLGPIGWVIAAVAILAAGAIYLYFHWKRFHDGVNATFGWIKDHWPLLGAILLGPFGLVIGIVITFRRQIGAAIDWVIAKARAALGWLSRMWSKVPGHHFIGGALSFAIPALADGGNITSGGTVLVGDRGPELLHLPRGAQVVPLTGVGQSLAAAGGRRLSVVAADVYMDSHKVGNAVFEAVEDTEATG